MSVSTQDIRNFVILGHQSSGKTTLGQAILYTSGAVNRLERVDDGNSSLDFDPEEIDRKMSISASLASCKWGQNKINLIDTPGYDDFSAEISAAMRVVESAVLVVRADGGVEVGTEKHWELLQERSFPRIIFINRMDKEHADYSGTLAQIREQLTGCSVVPFQVPIGQGADFSGVVDLVHMKAYSFDDKGNPTETEIPGDISDEVENLRNVLVEGAAEASEELMEKFFDAGTLTDEELIEGLSSGINEGTVAPVVLGEAFTARGVRRLLDTVTEFFPAPDCKPATLADDSEIAVDQGGPASALVFKNLSEMNMGDLYFMRVFSGTIKHGTDYHNLRVGSSERVGQIYTLVGKNREEIQELGAGDIGVAVKLKNTTFGDTLGVKGGVAHKEIFFRAPTIDMAIESINKGDEEKIGTGLQKLNREDPSFSLRHDNETSQMLISVQGDTQLDIILARLKRKFKVEVDTKKPKIAYKETIAKTFESHYRHKKQTGGRGQFGEVHIRLEPLPRGEGFEFANEITGGVIPGKFIPAVEKGVREAMQSGANSGYPVVDLRAALYFGSFHNVDSDEHSFKLAGAQALKEGVKQAVPVMLEPVYNLEIRVPDENLGDIMGDISGRRGSIGGTEQAGKYQVVQATAPLAELFKYGTHLRSMTQGRAMFSMEFSHYSELPHDQAEKVIAEAKAAEGD